MKKQMIAGNAKAATKMKRKTAIILAAVSAFVLAGIVALVLGLTLGGRAYDYTKKDLTKYLKLKRSDYIGIKVELTKDYSVTDETIADKLLALRIANRTDENNTVLALLDWGYDAHIYYWGTCKDEYGNDIQFSGGSNMASSAPSELTLGSGSFIDGFESGLVAARIYPADTGRDYNTTKGLEIGTTDIVYLSLDHYRYTDAEGTDEIGSFSNLRVDLSAPGLLGATFAEQIAKLKTGDSFDFGYSSSKNTAPLSIDVNGDGVTEELVLSGSVLALATREDSVEIKATFPDDYQEESLQGKTATFHVIVESVDEYDVPSEKSLTEKMVKTVYADFECDETGDAFLAALREHLRSVAAEEKAEERREDIENEIWKSLMENVKFTGKYPKKAVKENRKTLEAEMRSEYQYYSNLWYQQYQSSLGTFEEFVEIYYDVEKGDSWKDYLEKRAKEVTREEILVYSIVKAEKWLLTDAEYEAGKEELLEEYAELYDMDKDEVYDRIGRDAIYENILFEKLLTKLTENAEITEK